MNTFVTINMPEIKNKLLIIWKFHNMYPDCNHLPVFPYLFPYDLPLKKKKTFSIVHIITGA